MTDQLTFSHRRAVALAAEGCEDGGSGDDEDVEARWRLAAVVRPPLLAATAAVAAAAAPPLLLSPTV